MSHNVWDVVNNVVNYLMSKYITMCNTSGKDTPISQQDFDVVKEKFQSNVPDMSFAARTHNAGAILRQMQKHHKLFNVSNRFM